jgi:transposase
MQIFTMTGLSYPTVRSTIDLFETGGWSAIRPAVRGRARGDGRVLSGAQEDTIQRMIIDKRPEQLKMDFSLWSRAAVGQLIEHEFGIKLQVRSIGKYLTRWGFTPQKPIKRAYEQSPVAVQAWLEGKYPAIEQRARAEGAEIHWGDETALVNTDVRGSSFAPAGKTPVAMAVGGTRQKLSMIATVADRPDHIELFYLPSYSPQLNPEERLNADLTQEMGKRVPVSTKANLREAANDHMAMLEQNPERVMSYFKDRCVRYAAYDFSGPNQ